MNISVETLRRYRAELWTRFAATGKKTFEMSAKGEYRVTSRKDYVTLDWDTNYQGNDDEKAIEIYNSLPD